MNELQILLTCEVDGELIHIADYRAMVAPRVGEYVLLSLHPGYQNIGGEALASRHECLFIVERVEHIAYAGSNPDGFPEPFPYDKLSDTINLVVAPDESDAEASNYLARIAERNNPS